MNIKTKYEVGESVLYFHCNTMKLVDAIVKGIGISIDTANNMEIMYTLNLNEDCFKECEIIDDVINFLRGDRETVNPLVIPEKLLFASWAEFKNTVNPDPNLGADDGMLPKIVQSVTITLTEDVNTKEHSK